MVGALHSDALQCAACTELWLDTRLCALQIHWFSIINSCVTVLLLTGFLATILMRVLKNDFVKYTRDDEGGCPSWLACVMPPVTSCFVQQQASVAAGET